MLGGRSHHYLSHTHAPVKEYEIKGKAQEFCDYFLATNDGTQGFGLEIFWYQFQEQLVRRRQSFGELQHAGVAGRKSTHRRPQREQEWSIERAND
jgi:hypothetical protein